MKSDTREPRSRLLTWVFAGSAVFLFRGSAAGLRSMGQMSCPIDQCSQRAQAWTAIYSLRTCGYHRYALHSVQSCPIVLY